MKVIINNLPISIGWKHNRTKKHRSTECYVRAGIGVKAPLIIQSKSHVYSTDTFSRSIGRKKSLEVALKLLSEKQAGIPIILSKADRETIWNEYGKMTSIANVKPHYAKSKIKPKKIRKDKAVKQMTLALPPAKKVDNTPIAQVAAEETVQDPVLF